MKKFRIVGLLFAAIGAFFLASTQLRAVGIEDGNENITCRQSTQTCYEVWKNGTVIASYKGIVEAKP